MGETQTLPHKLTLDQRQKLDVSGVREVVCFDDTAVVLRTDLGTLLVQGRELQLKTLSLEGGQVDVTGTVSALIYEEPKRSGGVMRRLFG